MRSFAVFSTIATLAFSVLTSAAPLDAVNQVISTVNDVAADPVGSVKAIGSDVVTNPVGTVEGAVSKLTSRDNDTTDSLMTILNKLSTNVAPITSELSYLSASNATTDVVGPKIQALSSYIKGTITDVKALAGKDLSVVLAAVGSAGQVTETQLAQVLGSIISTVLAALVAVLKVVSSGQLSGVQSLLGVIVSDVAGLVGAVLAIVSSVLGGLLGALLGVVGDALQTLSTLGLGLGPLISVLGV